MRCSARWMGLALLLTSQTPAAAQTLKGSITDAVTNRPIGAAQIIVVDTLEAAVGTDLTTEDGRFDIPVRVGETYSLRLQALGYESFETVPFTIAEGDTVALQIVLEPSPVEIAGVLGMGHTRNRAEYEARRTVRLWDLLGPEVSRVTGPESVVNWRGSPL